MYNYQKAVCIASALLCLSATASAQQVTLRANNVTVKQAMNQLREKTGYTFVFSSTDVNTQRQVTVSATNADLSAVIEQILKGQKGIDYKIEGKNIIITKARHNGVKQPQDRYWRYGTEPTDLRRERRGHPHLQLHEQPEEVLHERHQRHDHRHL